MLLPALGITNVDALTYLTVVTIGVIEQYKNTHSVRQISKQ